MADSRAHRHNVHRMVIIMAAAEAAEIVSAMAVRAVSTADRHEDDLAADAGVRGLQGHGIVRIVVTGDAKIVNFAIRVVDRHPGRITSRPCVTG